MQHVLFGLCAAPHPVLISFSSPQTEQHSVPAWSSDWLLLLLLLPPCRQLEALIRISESFARMSLAGEADDGHVAASFDLFTKSTVNAMNAGLISNANERLEVRGLGLVKVCLLTYLLPYSLTYLPTHSLTWCLQKGVCSI
jgi:hypothetical protein